MRRDRPTPELARSVVDELEEGRDLIIQLSRKRRVTNEEATLYLLIVGCYARALDEARQVARRLEDGQPGARPRVPERVARRVHELRAIARPTLAGGG